MRSFARKSSAASTARRDNASSPASSAVELSDNESAVGAALKPDIRRSTTTFSAVPRDVSSRHCNPSVARTMPVGSTSSTQPKKQPLCGRREWLQSHPPVGRGPPRAFRPCCWSLSACSCRNSSPAAAPDSSKCFRGRSSQPAPSKELVRTRAAVALRACSQRRPTPTARLYNEGLQCRERKVICAHGAAPIQNCKSPAASNHTEAKSPPMPIARQSTLSGHRHRMHAANVFTRHIASGSGPLTMSGEPVATKR